jgi:Tfp pilus assembly protein PilN
MNAINFLPPSYAAAHAQRQHRFRLVLLLALVAVGIGGWYLLAGRQLTDLEHCAQAKTQAVDAAAQRASQVQALRTQCDGLNRQVRVQRELMAPITNTQVLAALGRLMPPSVSLTEVHLLGPAPAGHDPAVMHLTVLGLSPSDAEVATLVERMAKHVLFANVSLEFTKAVASGPVPARQFQITLEVPLDRGYQTPTGLGVADAH